jgi:GNAT superfamily N-acetyltransferase
MMRRIKETQRTRRSTIRHSTEADIQAIHEWLGDEDRRGVHGNFFCNRELIQSAHQNGKLLVYIDGKSSMPVGFQLGGLVEPGVLQVRNDYRGKGIGRKLVEHCVRLANKRDECLLYIQCKPSSSIPFWERMGFTFLPGRDGKNFAYRMLYRQHVLPVEGSEVDVEICFFPEKRKDQEATNPYLRVSPAAKLLPDGTVYLGERIFFYEALYPKEGGMVMGINVDGTRLFLDKAKCKEAQLIGLNRCPNGFYIDRIQTSYATDVQRK